MPEIAPHQFQPYSGRHRLRLPRPAVWKTRDLTTKRYVYVWADGIHLQARLEDDAQCILVVIGATPEGKKELIGFTVKAGAIIPH